MEIGRRKRRIAGRKKSWGGALLKGEERQNTRSKRQEKKTEKIAESGEKRERGKRTEKDEGNLAETRCANNGRH